MLQCAHLREHNDLLRVDVIHAFRQTINTSFYWVHVYAHNTQAIKLDFPLEMLPWELSILQINVKFV